MQFRSGNFSIFVFPQQDYIKLTVFFYILLVSNNSFKLSSSRSNTNFGSLPIFVMFREFLPNDFGLHYIMCLELFVDVLNF